MKKKRKKNKRKGKKLGKGDKENPSDIVEENTAKFKLSVSKTLQGKVNQSIHDQSINYPPINHSFLLSNNEPINKSMNIHGSISHHHQILSFS